jgi:1-deoxy-D-xylulose-5-phosphate synthase
MVALAKEIATEYQGVGVVSARTVKPLCTKTLEEIKDTVVVTLEENSEIGGFGSLVLQYYSQKGYQTKVVSKGVPDEFIKHSDVKNQLEYCRLSLETLREDLSEFLK